MKEFHIPIRPACYRVYVSAAKILRRKLGAKAPDAVALIRHELRNRDPEMVADDYLELRGGRHTARPVGVRRRARRPAEPRHRPRVVNRRPLLARSGRSIVRGFSAPADPTLN